MDIKSIVCFIINSGTNQPVHNVEIESKMDVATDTITNMLKRIE